MLPASGSCALPDAAASTSARASASRPMTAHRALTVAEDGPTRLRPGALEGRTVLVAGGAGAVGHAAIQLARWAGARDHHGQLPAKAALATAAGAHHVVNYDRGRGRRHPSDRPRRRRPDRRGPPARNAALNPPVLATRGAVAVYANDGGERGDLDVRQHFALNVRYQFLLLYTVGERRSGRRRRTSTRPSTTAALSVGEDAGLPLTGSRSSATAEAHDAVEAGTVGKVLIDVAAE